MPLSCPCYCCKKHYTPEIHQSWELGQQAWQRTLELQVYLRSCCCDKKIKSHMKQLTGGKDLISLTLQFDKDTIRKVMVLWVWDSSSPCSPSQGAESPWKFGLSNDTLYSRRLHLMKLPQPTETGLTTGDQVFKQHGEYFPFHPPHSYIPQASLGSWI